LAFMSAISDIRYIDISYSDITTKYVRLNPLIPISEEFRYRHQLPFRYWTKSISDIPIFNIDKSFPNDPSKIVLFQILYHCSRTHRLHVKFLMFCQYTTRVNKYQCLISDIRQKFISVSEIMSDSAHFSPISDVPISDVPISDVPISGSVRYR
jgi:hypothetical protein